jgi:hypothetical protein
MREELTKRTFLENRFVGQHALSHAVHTQARSQHNALLSMRQACKERPVMCESAGKYK